ncbi:MAG TPA: glycosyltransferase family 4 protein [Marinagarivorans sp.]
MKICYLVNQYPKISHTFIRREILALEALGASVRRVSIRQPPEAPLDAADIEENDKTDFIFSSSAAKKLPSLMLMSLTLMPKNLAALCVAFKMARAAGGGFAKHVVYWLEACWLVKYCKNHHVDHVHAHFGTNPATIAYLSRLMGGPEYSFTVHGPEEFDSPVALSLNRKIAGAKFVVAITSYCKSQLCRWANFEDWKKIVEVHCTVDKSMCDAPPCASVNPKRLVSIGRLCEQKGQLVLLQAINRVTELHPDVELHLVGDGDFRPLFERYIKEHDLEQNIKILGWMSSEQISSELDQSCAMVLPSFAEGLPVVIMEAFARGRPVITTYIAGIPELVSEANGWLVPAGNEEQLVAAINALLGSSQESLLAKGRLGKKAVLERHDAKEEASKLFSYIAKGV